MDRQLHFLALVELAAIPLYLFVKPHLDVWTQDEETEDWLANCLLPNLNDQPDADESSTHSTSPWWSRPAQQSDHGILLELRNGGLDSESPGVVITEFLIYAAVLKSANSPSYLSSPPASSSPLRINRSDDDGHEATMQKIRIRAVPLASTAHQFDCINHLNMSPTNDQLINAEAYFLPEIPNTTSAVPNSPSKRQRLLHLFEDATYQRKRLRRRGGEGISEAMAGLDRPISHIGNRQNSNLEEPDPNSQAHMNTLRRIGEKRLSRSLSTPSALQIEPARPHSKAQQTVAAKQSSLCGGDSVGSSQKASALPPDITSFEDQNRSTLSRIIMAGMRIYGLQQRRKSVKLKTDSELGTDMTFTDMSISHSDDEYKIVYHQTLKAATFAFRNQISKEIINQASMGDVVDQLLALFCTDPSSVQDNTGSFISGSGRDKEE